MIGVVAIVFIERMHHCGEREWQIQSCVFWRLIHSIDSFIPDVHRPTANGHSIIHTNMTLGAADIVNHQA
jgi:hypothetical protein